METQICIFRILTYFTHRNTIDSTLSTTGFFRNCLVEYLKVTIFSMSRKKKRKTIQIWAFYCFFAKKAIEKIPRETGNNLEGTHPVHFCTFFFFRATERKKNKNKDNLEGTLMF